MAHNTILTSKEIAKFANVYSLGKIIKFYPMTGGSSTHYFIQTRTQKYILTICEYITRQQALAQTNLLIYLHKHHFQTNQVISSKNHEYVLEHSGKPVYLRKFLEGGIVKRPTIQLIEQLGSRIAQLHDIPCPDNIQNVSPYGLDYLDEVTSSDIDHPYMEWLKTKLEYIEALIPDQLPKGLVHGDIFPDNIIQKNGNLVAIIDFEDVLNYHLIFDLGMVITGLLTLDNIVDMSYPKALIKGYQKVKLLTPIEIESLNSFCIYAAVTVSIWRFRQSHIRFATYEKSTDHQQMVDIADKLYEMGNSKFMSNVFD
ncbi:MAG: homoserine kinase [Candidatus Heimdallarchaeaceae archaeon]